MPTRDIANSDTLDLMLEMAHVTDAAAIAAAKLVGRGDEDAAAVEAIRSQRARLRRQCRHRRG